jgi:hypothetical protein
MSQPRASSYAPLLRLYPRAWRRRYEDEFLALLECRPPTPLSVLDIVLGAVDAHVHREIPTDVVTTERRSGRSWLMNRNLFTAYGDAVGLEAGLAVVLVPLMLGAVIAATLGLARRSHRSRLANLGALIAGIGAVASVGALALIALNERLGGLDGWNVGMLTVGALLAGQAIVAASAWHRAPRPGLVLLVAGSAWIVIGMAYMQLSDNWVDGLVAPGWAVVAAGWVFIGITALRSPAPATV